MDLNEFNDEYVNKLLDNIAKENKTILLLRESTIGFLKYDIHTPVNELLEFHSFNKILPDISHSTRVTSHSKTLNDNIISNHMSKKLSVEI